jgi:hypothetical protein
MAKRSDFKQRTSTSFTKTYGKRVYRFHIERVEIAGYVSVHVTVRVKPVGASSRQIGTLVHAFHFEEETG